MRQTSQISKLTSVRAGFMALALTIIGAGFSAAQAEEAPAAAPAAAAVVPGKPKTDPAAGEALYSNGDASRGVVACVGCHGPNGKSASGAWPKLAAQHPAYIVKQLKNFKEGTRANAVMMGMAAPLTEQDMANIAAYLGKQEPSPGVATNKDTIELGQSIYRGGIASKGVPACAGCHSPNGAGIPSQYPRLSGQWADYANAQLIAFREGTRINAPKMTVISSKMNDKEMKAVADYMAGLH
ncbi:c-type cytochrome [Polynucleobacter sphagniphilus]|uniref:c-type cytochrome n=1 Tax=Polynucleobacter sphagniphilus TaxID=1743169 RepID=UPI0009F9364E|nr:c-type cytochrome [Polynucleobacter sphagniphilus]